ncbi:MAG: choice-of-anchor D domain-containing protein [Ignavibacteriae bacterium]|nr:choice-of-anchor D domain-containing protein [Ignavibacteriota bacterium]
MGTNDCFWAMVNPKESMLNYATYLGGSNDDFGRAIAIYNDNIYCAGFTLSSDFQPIGGTGFTPNHKGKFDGFFCSQSLPIHSPNISPSSIDFGKVFINSTVIRDSIVIKNITSRPIRFTKTSQDFIPFALRHPLDSFTLNPLEQTVVYAYFTPDTKGEFGNIFDIQYETGIPFEIKVSGEGIAPSISMNPTDMDYGQLEIDSTKTRKLFIVNKGTASGNIHFSKFESKSLFKYIDDIVPNDTTLKVGEGIEVSIVFTASSEGSFSQDFIVQSDEIKLICKLKGEGVAPHFTWDRVNLFFGNVRLGQNVTLPVVLKNTGKARGKINSLQLINSKEFTLYVIDLPEDSIIHPGDIIQCNVTYIPTLLTSATDTLFAYTQEGELTFLIYGYSVYPIMEQLSEKVFDYKNISVGASSIKTISLNNSGKDVDTLYSMYLGNIAGEINFELVSTLAPGSLLSPESPIEFNVIFNPKSPGTKTDTAYIICGTNTFKTVLIGEGASYSFKIKDTNRFGNTRIDSTNQDTLFIENNGTETGFIGQMSIVADLQQNFSIDTSTLQNFWLAPKERSPIYINYSPKNIGVHTAKLEISNSSDDILSTYLRGESSGVIFESDVKFIEFDSTDVDAESDSSYFVIINHGNIPGTPVIKVRIDTEGSFVQLTKSKLIGHNDTAKIYYKFTPHSAGRKNAVIQISGSSNNKEGYTVQLYGIGRIRSTKAELTFRDTISARIGEKISIPLIVRNIDGKKLDSVRSVQCVLQYNSTVLGVEYPFKDSLVVNGDIALLSLQRTASNLKNGDTVLVLEFTVGLGNSPVTDIIVEKFVWKNEKDATIEISTSLPHSKVRVTDIAEINGSLRLYDKGHLAEMTLTVNTLLPNAPLSINIDGGLHCSSLIIYDERGRVVRDISFVLQSDKIVYDFDSSPLSMGMYYCVLLAGNNLIVKDFVVR